MTSRRVAMSRGHRWKVSQAVVLAIAGAALWASAALDLGLRELFAATSLDGIGDFVHGAVNPALDYQRPPPSGTLPLPLKVLTAMANTVFFAGAAMTLALLVGLPLGFLGSSVWWIGGLEAGGRRDVRLRRAVAPVIHGATRLLIALMRSIHELLWAVLLLAAFGVTHLGAVVAIAIPYGGTLAKVFAEMLDEAPRQCAEAYLQTGARPVQVFLFAMLPMALPDMGAYAFYRLECALRSSAVLGFFGFPTLGYYIAASFENLHYGEVWTYLYALFALVVLFDWWSGALRRSLL